MSGYELQYARYKSNDPAHILYYNNIQSDVGDSRSDKQPACDERKVGKGSSAS